MSLTESDLATLNEGSYYDTETARALAKTIHDDWDVDEDLSDEYTKVYHNKTANKTVAAFRGTKLKDPTDHVSNALYFVGLGKVSKRYKHANDKTNEVIAKYSSGNTQLVGHSLAGNVVSDVSKNKGTQATTFNKGRTALPKTKGKNETSRKVITDPISHGGTFKLPKTINPHSLKNFQN